MAQHVNCLFYTLRRPFYTKRCTLSDSQFVKGKIPSPFLKIREKNPHLQCIIWVKKALFHMLYTKMCTTKGRRIDSKNRCTACFRNIGQIIYRNALPRQNILSLFMNDKLAFLALWKLKGNLKLWGKDYFSSSPIMELKVDICLCTTRENYLRPSHLFHPVQWWNFEN